MSVIRDIEQSFKKPHVVDVKSGDTVRVHQKIREGSKERIQIFEGLVIQTKRKNSLSSTITVRRIASGIGVEKTFLVHSPLVTKIQVVKRSKVRRNYLSYMRARTGKSARLSAVNFDQDKVNYVPEPEVKDDTKPEEPVEEKTEAKDQSVEKPEAEKAEAPDSEASSKESKDEPKDQPEDKNPAESKK